MKPNQSANTATVREFEVSNILRPSLYGSHPLLGVGMLPNACQNRHDAEGNKNKLNMPNRWQCEQIERYVTSRPGR